MKNDVQKLLALAKKLVDEHAKGAEGFLLSFHVRKGDRVHHYFDTGEFLNADIGACMIAMGVEARRLELASKTGISAKPE